MGGLAVDTGVAVSRKSSYLVAGDPPLLTGGAQVRDTTDPETAAVRLPGAEGTVVVLVIRLATLVRIAGRAAYRLPPGQAVASQSR